MVDRQEFSVRREVADFSGVVAPILRRVTVAEARALLRSRRNGLGLSQTEVAAKAGVNPTTLNKIENTKKYPQKDVDLSVYLKIADVIGLTISSPDATASERNRPLSVGEREMQGAPAGRPYAGALSSED